MGSCPVLAYHRRQVHLLQLGKVAQLTESDEDLTTLVRAPMRPDHTHHRVSLLTPSGPFSDRLYR